MIPSQLESELVNFCSPFVQMTRFVACCGLLIMEATIVCWASRFPDTVAGLLDPFPHFAR